ncbi:Sigma-K factor [Cognatishimia activa]|uniref:RNA polymerase sigma factor n=2 Tax=Cognatishimia activa TaxID=1715691 RepID=A0A0P1IX94_9RHOB|nr:Sigma-K factor [Cognatishimia activa]CUK25913.1 Sigma-K factor [Cognatishimia activa]
MDEKNDPNLDLLRNPVMLTAEHALDEHHRGAPMALKRGRGKRDRLNDATQTEYSDQTVWMLAVKNNRDRVAFGMIFDFYAPRLKGFVMRTGVSGAQAEEIVQEVLLTVWRKADQFDPHRAQVSSWIYQIARNRQIDVIRKESRVMPEELSTDLKDEGASHEDASQIMAVEQEAETLRMALARLKPGQREMVEKAYLGELSHSEIQAETGLPLGTIKSRIRLGLEKLRHELKELRS